MTVSLDLDEGRYLELGCIACHEDVTAKYGMASPVRMYIAALYCSECLEDLIQFDAFSMEVK